MVETDSRSATLAEPENLQRSISPSPRGSLNKEEKINDETTDNEGSFKNADTDAEKAEIQYETGIRLTFIIIALLLSIFLVCACILAMYSYTDMNRLLLT